MWEEWIQQVGGSVIKDASQAKFVQPYELQKLQLTALGETGYYKEGQPQPAVAPGLFGMSQGTVLLLAVVVVGFFALRD